MSKKVEVDRDDIYGIRWGINAGTQTGLDYALSVVNRLLGDVKAPEIPAPSTPSEPSGPSVKIAIVVGHNSSAKGACAKSPVSQCEYDFNNKVADLLVSNPPKGAICKRFNRKTGLGYSREIDTVYSEVNSWNPSLSLELHFNAGGGKYSTMVVASISNVSKDFANIMQDEISSKYGFDKGSLILASRSSRGGRSVYAARSPIVLTEPFFGDNADHCKKIVDGGFHEGLAEVYRKGLEKMMAKIS